MMLTIDDDVDVLAKPAATAKQGLSQGVARTIRPDAPVFPTLASQCDCELVVNEDGLAMVIYTKTPPEGIEWVEYDADLAMLTFVTWSGAVMGLGMKIHVPFRKYLKKSQGILLAQMSEDGTELITLYPADLVVRHIGV